jgi:hypothetical protein
MAITTGRVSEANGELRQPAPEFALVRVGRFPGILQHLMRVKGHPGSEQRLRFVQCLGGSANQALGLPLHTYRAQGQRATESVARTGVAHPACSVPISGLLRSRPSLSRAHTSSITQRAFRRLLLRRRNVCLVHRAEGIANQISAAVTAARAEDRRSFTDAVALLAAVDLEQVAVVQSAVVRSLLEDLHPDGLTGDDARTVVDECVRGAALWLPDLNVAALIMVLTGALGMSDPDDRSLQSSQAETVRHASLLIDCLAGRSPTPLGHYLDGAIREIYRAETVELP